MRTEPLVLALVVALASFASGWAYGAHWGIHRAMKEDRLHRLAMSEIGFVVSRTGELLDYTCQFGGLTWKARPPDKITGIMCYMEDAPK